jgi:hypothetical protein
LSPVEVYGALRPIHYLWKEIFGNTTFASSENARVLCILTVEVLLEHESELQRVIRALIQEQRMLVTSTNVWERFGVLWIAALLDKRLKQCTDHEVGELMVIVQGRFGLFEPEFAVCYHARQRLLLGSAKERLT